VRLTLLSLVLLGSALGQITTGSVSGYVFDPSLRGIPNAKVTVVEPERSLTRAATTDSTGFYRIPDLPPASYRLAAAATGFAVSPFQELPLAVDQQARIDVHLALAGQEQSITVRGLESAIPTESSDLGIVIDQQRTEGLPLNERDFLQLALLTPGVAPPVEGSELASRAAFAMQANGAREDTNNFLLDGVDNNDQDTNRYVLQPPVDTVQEFKIATNSYSAEYGRNAGAQVNVITRSGTNELHGFAYDYLRNRVLDATNSFNPDGSAKLIRNQFGAGAGGPLVKNKTFFFVNFDALRGLQGLPQYGTVPTLAERQGDLSGLGTPVIDPFSGQPFPNNVIPPSRISPFAGKVLGLFPLPTSSGLSGNFFGQPVENDANTQFTGRLDHQLTSRNQLTLRYSYGRKNLFEPFTQESTELPGFGDYVYDRGHNAMIHLQSNVDPGSINSLTIGLNRATRDIYQQNYQTDVNQLWGVNYLPTQPRDFGYPSFSVTGFSHVGDVTEIPIIRAENTYQINDVLSIVRGSHGIKIGAEVRRIQQNGFLDIYSRGSISFSGAISGSGVSDLLLGFPSFTLQSQSNNPQTQRTTSTGVFVQDDWKVNRCLTLNLGLRYEYNSPPVDPYNRMSAFNLATGTIAQVGTDGVSRSGIRPDYTNFAPRVGFAYALDSNTVLRGGYGIYYDAGTLTVNSAMYFNPPYFNIYVFFPTQASLLTMANPFPLNGGYSPPATLSTLDPNLTTAYIQSWNLNLQREVHGVGTFSVAYAGSKGTHLIRSLDLNQPYPGPGPISSRAPYPQYSNIFFAESSADSEYQSLQFSFNRRLARGLSVLAAYTFSKSMDDTSAFLGTTGDPNFPQNSHDYHAEHALSSFDTPQRAVIAYVYDLPFRNRLLRHLETAAIITAQSGQPFTPILEEDNSNTGNIGGQFGSDRPNVVGNPSLPDPSAAEWFNTSAFAIPAPYTFGNAGRNILRGPGLATVDMSLSRRFQIAERASLLVQAQAFNMLNRENLNLPDLYVDSPATFGKIFSAKDPRQVQLAMRFSF
jgi:Carboxypeptidase regulatory-like domain/TonB dependent receptor